jgi:hypothetical protein
MLESDRQLVEQVCFGFGCTAEKRLIEYVYVTFGKLNLVRNSNN